MGYQGGRANEVTAEIRTDVSETASGTAVIYYASLMAFDGREGDDIEFALTGDYSSREALRADLEGMCDHAIDPEIRDIEHDATPIDHEPDEFRPRRG